MTSEILTVTQLTNEVKNHLEPRFAYVQVKGEITTIREQASGHIYFTLKDAGAQLPAALFRGAASKLTQKPKSGDQVVATGELSVYPPRGGYQLIVRELKFAGVGDLLLLLHQRKEKYHKLGYFSSANKKPLPSHPKTIGVVTSPTGSVIQDIIQVLSRRFNGFHLILNPVRVQGETAAREIAGAIDDFNREKLADVLIVGRGGGSLEDLWPFNEEAVAEAVHRSEIPIISAVGHETDHSICDYVADVRAPTPSAAAELAVKEQAQEIAGLHEARKQIDRAITSQMKMHAQMADDQQVRLDQTVKSLLSRERLKCEGLARQLQALRPSQQLQLHRQRLGEIHLKLQNLLLPRLKQDRMRLQALGEKLAAMHPNHILSKGYCIPFTEKKDSIIMNARDAVVGEKLSLLFHDGHILTKVENHD